MVWLARCNKSEAEQWLLKACAETPDRREPFVELAELYFNEERWEPALGMAQRAISMTNKNLSYISEDKAWGFLPHHIAAICAYTIKAPDLALHHGKIASSLMPDDENLKKNLEWYEKGYVEEKAEEAS
jgi:tetratricopeptide (TPR) repeat protein